MHLRWPPRKWKEELEMNASGDQAIQLFNLSRMVSRDLMNFVGALNWVGNLREKYDLTQASQTNLLKPACSQLCDCA